MPDSANNCHGLPNLILVKILWGRLYYLYPLYRWGNEDTTRLNNLLKATGK